MLYAPMYKDFIRKIFIDCDWLSGASIFYSFNYGMGMDISAYISREAFFSPLNILYLIIDDINYASALIVCIKISLAASFFSFFLKKTLSINNMHNIVWSLLYAYSAYFVMFYFNIQFLEGGVLLPLVITFCYDLASKNRASIKLTLTYFILFINGFYSGYIVGIFSFVFFLSCVFAFREGERIKVLFRYFLSVLHAFGLSAFILLPTAHFLLSNPTADKTLFDGNIASVLDIFSSLYLGVNQGVEAVSPYIYSGLLVWFLIPAFFISKKVCRRTKIVYGICLCFLFLCCCIPFLYIAMHCFDAPDGIAYRFTYLISFCLVTVCAISFEKLTEFTNSKKNIILFSASFLVSIIYYIVSIFFVKGNFEWYSLGANFFFLLVYWGLLLRVQKERIVSVKRRLCSVILDVVVLELFMNFFVINNQVIMSSMQNKKILYPIERDCKNVVDEILLKDDGVYRVYVKNEPHANYNMLLNTYDVAFFGTFENYRIRKVLHDWGLLTSPRYTSDYGLTDATKMILGYKYNAYNKGYGIDDNITEPFATEEDLFLGLGYMVNDDILLYTGDVYDNAFECINGALSAMVGRDITYYEELSVPYETIISGVNLDENFDEIKYFEYDGTSNVGVYSIQYNLNNIEHDYMDERYSFYSYFLQDYNMYYENGPIAISSLDVGTLSTKASAYASRIIPVEVDDDGKAMVSVLIVPNSSIDYYFYKNNLFYVADKTVLKNVYDLLSNNILNIDMYIDGYVKGNIDVGDKYDRLFISIPYDSNWKMYVDGNETFIEPCINDAFISCHMDPGHHEIELKYHSVFVDYGIIISILGGCILILRVLIKNGRLKIGILN